MTLIGQVAGLGWSGVTLFFVLSGYLIAMVLSSLRETDFCFERFWCRRLFRILPAYFMLLVAYFLARLFLFQALGGAHAFDHIIPDWSHFLFIQNFFMAKTGYLGNGWLRVTWSLAIEMQFYLFISLLFLWIPGKYFWHWSAGLACLALILRYLLFFTAEHADAALVVLFPCRMDSFFMGCMLYSAVSLKPHIFQQKAFRLLMAAIAVVSFALVWLVSVGAFYRYRGLVSPLYYSWLNLGFTALLALGLGPPANMPIFRLPLRFLTLSGRWSYFLYLFHFPVLLVLFRLLLKGEPNLLHVQAMGVTILALATVYVLAAFSYKYIEHPLIKFSHPLFEKPGQAVEMVPAAKNSDQ